ncbi:MAG: galactose-1-phosphate uridylyltransferase [Chloroflexi bacterium]|uniref:Galactose-1-phosphate uridylyltransferase n=1 Tax=Candidatus Chlorohelix allophototropha TaxID=3003348 RepID=A0A8T7M6C3_9CHLR|nr:galactose-1-phosphate uridylyltransferase [Chloroflexota bacterium]WJW69574.1 galactose-1-phosphate uridylyltransferase [Chloroflexota bacterium L227-S17]
MGNTHIRLNRATREWVIYAPSRRIRPQEFRNGHEPIIIEPPYAADCSFCKFDDAKDEVILFEIKNADGDSWLTRVVQNKYPALSPDQKPTRSLSGIYLELPGYGHHEVVIESPEHNLNPAMMSLERVNAIVETYRQRYLELMKIRDNLFIIIFRNHGKTAGASMQHPHSQIIATPIVPRHYRWREDEAQRYFDEWGRCAYCDTMEFEVEDRKRVVGENEHFLAFVPFAAEVPFEIWIMPKEHRSDFGTISPKEVTAFAALLHEVLAKLYTKLNNPNYNYAIMSAARYKSGEPQLHWYCQISPRLTIPAGFEMGSGISINPSLPEADANFLNDLGEA